MDKPFTEYLQTLHYNENPTILDDDLPDHFDNWICNIDLENLGNNFIKKLASENVIKALIKELT